MRFLENPDLTVKEVADLRRAVGWDGREEQMEKIIGRTYLTVACFDGELLVGFVDVISDEVEDALIRNLLVHPEYRRQGLGLKLLEIAIKKIKADRIKTINVLFEPELAGLYRKAGFKIVSGGMIDNEAEGF